MSIYLKIFIILILIPSSAFGITGYFEEGLKFFKNNELEKAKFKFEQVIVYNPKNEKAYLYLSKIYKEQDKKDLEEKNLNTVILLNPKNEEATYNLAKLKLTKSDYTGSKKLVDRLQLFCKAYCKKNNKLKAEVEKSLKK